jgi:Predicted sugar phosphate isomerase
MISTTIMIQLGRVEGNKMVNVKLMNAKLMDRAARIFMERNPHINDYDYIVSLLKKCGGIKQAERYLKSLND